MTHLPDSDLRELEGLLARATPPARWNLDRSSGRDLIFDGAQHIVSTRGPNFIENAALIVAAVNALPSLIADLREARGRIKRLETGYSKMNEEVCQVLGKALGYPWFKDDPKNFPNATEANGVCVGEHVAESLADAAAARIKELEGKT